MKEPGSMVLVSFCAIVLVVFGVFVWMGKRAGERSEGGSPAKYASFAGGSVLLWLGVGSMMSLSGFLSKFDAMPPNAVFFLLPFTLFTAIVAFSKPGRLLLEHVPLVLLVGFQAFRLPLELVLHQLYVEGVIPVQMTYSGMNFDIISGLTAIGMALWLWMGKPPKWALLVWNCLGSVLVLTIAAIAVLSLPGPMRKFTNEPVNLLPTRFPYVWIVFLVQAAIFGHLLIFRKLFSGADTAEKNV